MTTLLALPQRMPAFSSFTLLLVLVLILTATAATTRPKLSFGFKPLIGGPKFVPIHVYITLQQDAEVSYLDFLPIDPTNPSTLQRLILGQDGPGEIRDRRTPGYNDDQRLIEYMISGFNKDINLYTNNCYHFAYHCAKRFHSFDWRS